MKHAIAAATLAFAALGSATTISTYADWDGSVTNGWAGVAQSFDAPGSMLVNYKFGIDGGSGTINVSLMEWIAGSGPAGPALFSTSVSWPAVTGDVELNGINVALNQGSHYAMFVDFGGNAGSSVHYMGNTTGNPSGHGYWWNGSTFSPFSGLSTKFEADFAPVPEPGTMIALGLGLAAAARRRRS